MQKREKQASSINRRTPVMECVFFFVNVQIVCWLPVACFGWKKLCWKKLNTSPASERQHVNTICILKKKKTPVGLRNSLKLIFANCVSQFIDRHSSTIHATKPPSIVFHVAVFVFVSGKLNPFPFFCWKKIPRTTVNPSINSVPPNRRCSSTVEGLTTNFNRSCGAYYLELMWDTFFQYYGGP